MSELGSIFNPGEAEMAQELASEKILPAPSPIAGDPPSDDEGEAVIPLIPGALGWAMPPQQPVIRRPEELEDEDEDADAERSRSSSA
ncbi:hypothetical protein [uncultured Demequina sp.]|uniref:hypothetical protein n=1 Tax=uncultured Demequina sp. TaxID=693499 RepID=UPI0025CE2D86|nr:hypothetical protein [uncultured Demequina sp.]